MKSACILCKFQIFEGHFLPGMTLSENYLNNSFMTTRMFLTDSRYNTTFTLVDVHQTDSKGKVLFCPKKCILQTHERSPSALDKMVYLLIIRVKF